MRSRELVREAVPQDIPVRFSGPPPGRRGSWVAGIALALVLPLVGCGLRDQVLRSAFVAGGDYSNPPGTEESVEPRPRSLRASC